MKRIAPLVVCLAVLAVPAPAAADDAASDDGARVRTMAHSAFARYAAAGRLLIQAVNDVVAGNGRSVVEPKVKRAGLIPELVRG